MAESRKRIDVRYGAFACSIEGFDEPADTLKQILGLLQTAVERIPNFPDAGMSLDEQTMGVLLDDLSSTSDTPLDQLDISPGLIVVRKEDKTAPAATALPVLDPEQPAESEPPAGATLGAAAGAAALGLGALGLNQGMSARHTEEQAPERLRAETGPATNIFAAPEPEADPPHAEDVSAATPSSPNIFATPVDAPADTPRPEETSPAPNIFAAPDAERAPAPTREDGGDAPAVTNIFAAPAAERPAPPQTEPAAEAPLARNIFAPPPPEDRPAMQVDSGAAAAASSIFAPPAFAPEENIPAEPPADDQWRSEGEASDDVAAPNIFSAPSSEHPAPVESPAEDAGAPPNIFAVPAPEDQTQAAHEDLDAATADIFDTSDSDPTPVIEFSEPEPAPNIFATPSTTEADPPSAEPVDPVPAPNIFAAPDARDPSAATPDSRTDGRDMPSAFAPLAREESDVSPDGGAANIFATPPAPDRAGHNIFAVPDAASVQAEPEETGETGTIFSPPPASGEPETSVTHLASADPVEDLAAAPNIFAAPSNPAERAEPEPAAPNIFADPPAAETQPADPPDAEVTAPEDMPADALDRAASTPTPGIFAPPDAEAAPAQPVSEPPPVPDTATGDAKTQRATDTGSPAETPTQGWRNLFGPRQTRAETPAAPSDPEPDTLADSDPTDAQDEPQSPPAPVDAAPAPEMPLQAPPLPETPAMPSSQEIGAPGEMPPAVPRNAPDMDAGSLARAASAASVPDLLAASAAWLTLCDGEARFTRRQVMNVFDTIPGDHPRTLEARIRGYGELVRNRTVVLVDDGYFALAQPARDHYGALIAQT